ncbi:hypothetical protein AMAG_00859 [Allomyces macrogynus ATCC 38327]|uniref:RGS domain-containing protein n=1 Tax=Allomyces macrogynus (strain ATCC 38327) TaxID=578462 RepID=A0A0L0RXP5_ALLM3|nr:hypothetical protein AMAG_00859 [Allomyces macrogynus ATCC 38327]|eukprot:KNE54915.1 hypothetical protein AMAG_00859 [Allomyces macrogynus ATCC 38327]
MAEPHQIAHVAALCRTLYTSSSLDERQASEQALAKAFPTFVDHALVSPASPTMPMEIGFTARTPFESMAQSSIILEQTNDRYVQTFVTNHLKILVAKHFALMSLEEKKQMKEFILGYLQKNTHAERFVISSLAQILALILKLAWFDDDKFSQIMTDMGAFINSPVPSQIECAQILTTLVNEMNNPSLPTPKVSKVRKAVVAFRDTQLVQVFQAGISFLNRLLGNGTEFASDDQRTAYMVGAVTMIRACLGFDFIGTSPDESSDDVGSIQVPGSWRPLLDDTFVSLIFRCYTMFATSGQRAAVAAASTVMECLSFIVAVRRSLFNEKERQPWVTAIMRDMKSVLTSGAGLDNVESYHELCKTLSRFKTVYNLSELAQSDQFEDWLQAVVQFSVQGLTSWKWSPNSDPYLLTFWSKSALSTIPGNDRLTYFTSLVAERFIASRVEAFEEIAADDLDDPFEDEEVLISNLELLANFARRQYDQLVQFVSTSFNAVFTQYKGRLVFDEFLKTQRPEQLMQLTYLIYVIAAFLGARQPYQSPERHDQLDGELSCHVLETMNFHQGLLPNASIDMAILYFFSQFRKSYVGESERRTSQVYTALARFRVEEQEHVMELMAQHIVWILRNRANEHAAIFKTLKLFDDLSMGYVSVKLLSKIETVKALLGAHNLPFLDGNPKFRMRYYATLSRLLFAEEINDAQFAAFVRPLDDQFQALALMQASNSLHVQARDSRVQQAFTNVFRDLRGLLTPVMNKRNYALFFDWLFPDKLHLMFAFMQACVDVHAVVNPLLKFYLEFAQNRSNRLVTDGNSVNGILLFRETSRLLQFYSLQRVNDGMTSPMHGAAAASKVDEVYKGITTCLRVYRNNVGGNFVNFGVFALYGDDALEAAMDAVSALIVSVPLPHMLAYPKLCLAFFETLDTMTQPANLALLTTIDVRFFAYMTQALAEAIKSAAPGVAASATNAVDNLATFLYTEQTKPPRKALGKAPHCIVQAFTRYPEILASWMSLLLNTVLFEETTIQWSLSRPLLPLVLLNRDLFDTYCQHLVQCQLRERQEQIATLLRTVMNDVDLMLTSKMRDKLTSNITQFRRETTAQNLAVMIPPEFPLPMF